jgi:hypothetical protein
MLTLFIFLAGAVEGVNELTFGRIFGEGKALPKLGYVLPFTALGFGVAVSFAAQLSLLTWAADAIAGATLKLISPAIDYFATGVLISAGSRWLHQFLSSFAPDKSAPSTKQFD